MWALSVVAMGLGELHYVSSRPGSECSKRYCSLSCNLALSCLDIQRVRPVVDDILNEGLSHAAPNAQRWSRGPGEGLQYLQTARPHIPPIYEMYSLRWNAKASQQE